MSSIRRKSLDWLYGFFLKRNNSGDSKRFLSDDMDIFDAQLIDSLGMVELLTGIESEFNIELSFEELDDPRFRSIRGIAEIINSHIQDRGQSSSDE